MAFDQKKANKVREMNRELMQLEAIARDALGTDALDPDFYRPLVKACHEVREVFHAMNRANE